MQKTLPPYRGNKRVIRKNQTTNDIVNEVLNAHNAFKKDYDNIAGYYDAYPPELLARKLYNFCKQNIKYKVESENFQTTRSPSGIIRLGHGDCKHYAGFIAGVIDAVGRSTGKPLDWSYRFASYALLDPTPVHVFVVINDGGNEIWIDPVLKDFNSRIPYPSYYTDKKPKNMLVRLAGIGKPGLPRARNISGLGVDPTFSNLYNQQAAKVAALDSVVTSEIPFYDLAKGLLTSFFGKGGISDWLSPSGIMNEIRFALMGRMYRGGQYWLGEKFKYYILGEDIHTRDADTVTDEAVSTAITVFSVGFGVPIEDFQDILNLDVSADAYINRWKLLGVNPADINLAAVSRAVNLKKMYFPANEVKTGVVPQKWDPNNFNKIPFAAPIPDFKKDYPNVWKYTYTGPIPGGEVRDGVVIAGYLKTAAQNLPQTSLPGTSGPINIKTIALVGGAAVAAYFLLRKRPRR